MPSLQKPVRVSLDDARQAAKLASIVSPTCHLTGVGQPEFRFAAMAFDVDVRGLFAVDGAESEGISALCVDRAGSSAP
jgi:hypothetical protein